MIDSRELCNRLGIHENTLYNYIKKGMPCVKLDKKYVFDYDEVIKWFKERNK